jgi:beta-glucanase (GH16 family)
MFVLCVALAGSLQACGAGGGGNAGATVTATAPSSSGAANNQTAPTLAANSGSSPSPGAAADPTISPSGTPSPGPSPNVSPTPFATDLSNFNSPAWQRSDGFANGGVFAVGWRADHAVYDGSQLTITLDDVPCSAGCAGEPYASGELQTTATSGYGTYQVDMQTVAASGVVSTLFTYINTTPNGPETNDEIDVEIAGAQPDVLQATYYKLGGPGIEHDIQLGFDSSAGFHTYAIEWMPDHIAWRVDGAALYTVNGNASTLPTTPPYFMLNFWTTGSTSGQQWLGPFNYTGPLQAHYRRASFVPAAP